MSCFRSVITSTARCCRLNSSIASVAVLGLVSATIAFAGILDTAGLNSITMVEYTGGPDIFTWNVTDPALTSAIPVITGADNIAATTAGEYFDVFVCNADGTLNPHASFLRIDCRYTGSTAGMNIDAVGLDFTSGTVWLDMVASYVLGSGGLAVSVPDALGAPDGGNTWMGITPSAVPMTLIVGFQSGVVKPKRRHTGVSKALYH